MQYGGDRPIGDKAVPSNLAAPNAAPVSPPAKRWTGTFSTFASTESQNLTRTTANGVGFRQRDAGIRERVAGNRQSEGNARAPLNDRPMIGAMAQPSACRARRDHRAVSAHPPIRQEAHRATAPAGANPAAPAIGLVAPNRRTSSAVQKAEIAPA